MRNIIIEENSKVICDSISIILLLLFGEYRDIMSWLWIILSVDTAIIPDS